MKKVLFSALVVLLATVMLVSCGKAGNSSAPSKTDLSNVSVDSLKTMGDIIALNIEEKQTAAYEGYYVYAFNLNDTYYRAISTISKDTFDKILDLDASDKKYDEQLSAIIAPIKIEKMENLTENIPSQDELDKYIGKTCGELLDSGWSDSGYNLNDQEFWMDYECYNYTVVFDGTVEPEDTEDFDAYEKAKDLKVKSIKYNSIGDATYMEIEETEETEEAE